MTNDVPKDLKNNLLRSFKSSQIDDFNFFERVKQNVKSKICK